MKPWIVGASALSLLFLVGCGSGSQVASKQANNSGSLLINGAGATFPYPIYSKWLNEYHKLHPNLEINYQAIGSGGGIRQLLAGTVDFGASDMPMTDQMLARAKEKILHFPTVLGADVPTYNLPGLKVQLRFTPQTLAELFLGKIKSWNDPRLARANPGVKLPNHEIVIVHRSDGSGTTFVWTDYLSKISPEWRSKVGASTSVNWPIGLGAKGNEGVSGLVEQTPYSLGYVELIYALQNKLTYGIVRNSSGNFVKPDLSSVTAAAAGAAANMPADFRVSIVNAPGAKAYPISSFTWMLIPAQIPDAAKRDALKGFLHWMLTDGQTMVESLDYAPLPPQIKSKEIAQISEIH
ncbi:MAG: phosphate ABC transporter substrate-binding protein PstS [Terriglobia bacterium]